MRHISLLLLCLGLVVPGIALAQQRQQYAIVKTRGRLQDDGGVLEGRRIPGAIVVVREGSRAESDDNGELSFGVPSSDGFYISSISKEGYTLSDADVVSKAHKYQTQPIDLLLESVDELNAYRRSIERKVRRNYQRQLDLLAYRIDSLELLADTNAEEISRQRAELERSYDVAEKYIEDMTQRYLNIDFDRENEFDREISLYILNGELDRADSMLATRGDIIERVNQNIIAQNAVERDMEQIANVCYRKYEIAHQRLERDTAAYYLKLRAQLNPHNIDWQIDAVSYLCEIMGNYGQALSICEQALDYSFKHYGDGHEYTILLCCLVGPIYLLLGYDDMSIEYYQKALLMSKKNLAIKNVFLGASYKGLGAVYILRGDNDLAFKYYKKALFFTAKGYGARSAPVANMYVDIGNWTTAQGYYKYALKYYRRALEIFKDISGPATSVASAYCGIGNIHFNKGNYELSLDYFHKTLEILEKNVSSEHFYLGAVYLSLGGAYYGLGNYNCALGYFQKALTIFEDVFEEDHPYVNEVRNSIEECKSKL